ncbi:homeotic protein caudal isoform X2 [Toxorhynchites rutilus septentrionalis]|uniref:homeotic protein caudal isoform X2 n=1 Tax=Toxorhynchites rutilus septentrionalis TaxID=329112 RepID=UPI002478BD4A|nr:homeotic protein caudal isoform X2 [Toxorhynchites rutilus septentrionalis]
MVSYYNHFAMYPKNHSGNLPYSATSGWYPPNYQHQPPHPQFIGDGETSPQPMYYSHHHVFHQSSPDWNSHENFTTPPQSALLPHGPSPGGLHLGPAASGHASNNNVGEHMAEGMHSIPSPPITVSGSDMSSPGVPTGSSSPHVTSRPTPVKSPFEWMKKQSYQSQPNPGKTRTKDKYRVVYTDQQRVELEKEFHFTRYITIRRKSELAQSLQLSERQVKIWFQNRRAKDRKQKKKAENGSVNLSGQSLMAVHSQHNAHHQGMSSLLVDTKPKLEPSLHLSHLHQMSAMSMGMGSMGLHPAHHHLHHPHLGMPTTQHLNQGSSPQMPPTSLSIM